jgi:hypothetical protein
VISPILVVPLPPLFICALMFIFAILKLFGRLYIFPYFLMIPELFEYFCGLQTTPNFKLTGVIDVEFLISFGLMILIILLLLEELSPRRGSLSTV